MKRITARESGMAMTPVQVAPMRLADVRSRFGPEKNVINVRESIARSVKMALAAEDIVGKSKGLPTDTWDWRKQFASKESAKTTFEFMERVGDDLGMVGIRTLWEESRNRRIIIQGRESAAYVDFPYLCSTNVTMSIYKQALESERVWQKLVKVDPVMLMNTPNERASLARLGLLERNDGEAHIGEMADKQLTLAAYQFKRAYQIEIVDIINDRLGIFGDLAGAINTAWEDSIEYRLAYQMNAAISTKCTESGQTSYNFYSTDLGNYGTTALTADTDGMNALLAARTAILGQMPFVKDSAQVASPMNVPPRYLVVPYDLEGIAEALCTSPTVPKVVGSTVVLAANEFMGMAEPLVFPFLHSLDATDYYLECDPDKVPSWVISPLRGMMIPTVKFGWNTGGRALDSYVDVSGFPLYPVYIEVRFIYDVNPFDYRGSYRSHN